MKGRNLFLITALPTLGKLGDEPPLTCRRLREHVSVSPGPLAIVESILLSDDLLQREALLAGEKVEPDPSVLTEAQLEDRQPLPEYLAPTDKTESRKQIAGDETWEAYFCHAARIAEHRRNAFLREWVGYEVALRDALAVRRAETLQLDPAGYTVAADLADTDRDFTPLLNEWAAAETPLDALRILDQHRWDWLMDHDRWFSFDDDELAAYAAKLMLVHRWHRMKNAQKASPVGNFAESVSATA